MYIFDTGINRIVGIRTRVAESLCVQGGTSSPVAPKKRKKPQPVKTK